MSTCRATSSHPIQPILWLWLRSTRSVLGLGTILCTFGSLVPTHQARAQESRPYHYTVSFLPIASVKPIIAAFVERWPEAELKFKEHPFTAELSASHPITREEMRYTAQSAGSDLIDLVPDPAKSAALDPGFEAFPKLQATGDPLGDEARYQAEKSAWIAAYPQLYQLLLTGALDHMQPTK